MEHMYKRIEDLCEAKEINITQMCRDAGVPRSAISDYKTNRKKSISLENMRKIAHYFQIPLAYLTNEPPFDVWEHINNSRSGFFYYLTDIVSPFFIEFELKCSLDKPDSIPLLSFIRFISDVVLKAVPDNEGNWFIVVKSVYLLGKGQLPPNLAYESTGIPGTEAARMSASDVAHPLLSIYNELNEAGREALMEVAESMQYNPKYKKCCSGEEPG